MIKKFQIELLVLGVLILYIFFSHNIDYNIDIRFYNFFQNFDSSLKNIYLKEFFKQITVLGDSKWYFALSFLTIILYCLIIRFDYFDKHKFVVKTLRNFAIFLFLSLILTSLLTQLLKHVIGRPRPNYTFFDDSFEFRFFNLNSDFHSFPSGHTSTIFIVALVIIFFIPKLKYFFLFLAGTIAFSRIAVGAHFFTDVIGGIVISYLGIKLTKSILDKYYPISTIEKEESLYGNKVYFSLVMFFFLVIILTVGSSIDIYFSSLFYYGKSHFLLQSYYVVTIFFRKIVLPLLIIYIFILPIISIFFPLKLLYFNYKFNIKDLVFLWISGAVNLLIIVNLVLKNNWGRARPGDIFQLGGKENFSPWYQISNACDTNCSFVSGDAGVGFSLIAIYFLTKKEIFFWLSIFFGFGLGLIRIMEGGHFVSDIVMSAAILYLSYYFQTKYYIKKYV